MTTSTESGGPGSRRPLADEIWMAITRSSPAFAAKMPSDSRHHPWISATLRETPAFDRSRPRKVRGADNEGASEASASSRAATRSRSVPEGPGFDELIAVYQEDPDRYATVRSRFEEKRGYIQELYIAKEIHAGAGVLRPNHWWGRLTRTRSLCVRYDGSANGQPEFEAAIWRARQMERKARLMLSGRSQRSLVEMIYAIVVYLLSVLDATHAAGGTGPTESNDEERARRAARIDSATKSAEAEMSRLDEFVDDAARRTTLREYLLGVLIGLISCGFLAQYSDGWTRSLAGDDGPHLAEMARISFACGAVGGVISVLARITRRETLDVDSVQGWGTTALAGALRPVIGATFGMAVFVFITGGLLPIQVPGEQWKANLFFASLTFIAGFAERWAQDTTVHTAPSVRVKRDAVDPADRPTVQPTAAPTDAPTGPSSFPTPRRPPSMAPHGVEPADDLTQSTPWS